MEATLSRKDLFSWLSDLKLICAEEAGACADLLEVEDGMIFNSLSKLFLFFILMDSY